MQSAAASWLMTDLNPDPRAVAMVQVITALPMFIFGLPAGALADILNRRRVLLVTEFAATLSTAIFALLISLGTMTEINLLAFIFVYGVASALMAPAWQAIVPQLVDPPNLPSAVALNSVSVNISRAIGPALAGLLIAYFGIAAPFWLNVVANLGVLGALLWWRDREVLLSRLPPERFDNALRVGLRYARHNRHLQATLIRATGFFLFASAYWALLPLVARNQINGGPGIYGILLGAIGAGAVSAAFFLPRVRKRLEPDVLFALASVCTALALALFGCSRHVATGLIASLLAGISWIAVLATINVSAQLAVPEWVRGRSLALLVTVMFGAMTLGSAVWGQAAATLGLSTAHYVAAAGALIALPLLRRWKLRTGEMLDLTPSMHWPQPILAAEVAPDRGPVMVTVEYMVPAGKRDTFVQAICAVARQRKRNGAYDWAIYEDAACPERYLETFLVDSWLEHLRQHERVTNADRLLEDTVKQFQTPGDPKVKHFIAVRLRTT